MQATLAIHFGSEQFYEVVDTCENIVGPTNISVGCFCVVGAKSLLLLKQQILCLLV